MNAILSFLKKRNTQSPVPLHRCFTCLELHYEDKLRRKVIEVEICGDCETRDSGSADDIEQTLREAGALPRIGPEVPDPQDLDGDPDPGFPPGRGRGARPNHGVLRSIRSTEESCLVSDNCIGTDGGAQMCIGRCRA